LANIDYANEAFTAELLMGGGLVITANVLLQLPWSFAILGRAARWAHARSKP